MKVRLQKVISENSKYSRRKAELLIAEKRVSVNGKIISELGTKVDPFVDEIEIDFEPLKIIKKSSEVIAFNKPIGVVSSMKGENSLEQFFSKTNTRFFHIGRLDKDSHGLLLLTNDGNIGQKISHPSNNVEKKYLVKIFPHLTPANYNDLKKGIKINDGTNDFVKFNKIKNIFKNSTEQVVEVVLTSGKNRIIRRVFSQIGIKVIDLQRTQIGNIKLGELKVGKYRKLSDIEINSV